MINAKRYATQTIFCPVSQKSGLYFVTMYQVLIDNVKYCIKICPLKKIRWTLRYRPKHNEKRLCHTQDLTVCIW